MHDVTLDESLDPLRDPMSNKKANGIALSRIYEDKENKRQME